MSVAQSTVLAKIVELWRARRAGRYETHRGFIDWSTWSFAAKPYAVAIWIHEETFLASAMNPEGMGIDAMTVRMDVASRWANPDPTPGDAEHYALHPTTLDEIREDVKAVCVGLAQAVDGDGNGLVHRIHSDVATEWHNAQAALQGRLIDITIDH